MKTGTCGLVRIGTANVTAPVRDERIGGNIGLDDGAARSEHHVVADTASADQRSPRAQYHLLAHCGKLAAHAADRAVVTQHEIVGIVCFAERDADRMDDPEDVGQIGVVHAVHRVQGFVEIKKLFAQTGVALIVIERVAQKIEVVTVLIRVQHIEHRLAVLTISRIIDVPKTVFCTVERELYSAKHLFGRNSVRVREEHIELTRGVFGKFAHGHIEAHSGSPYPPACTSLAMKRRLFRQQRRHKIGIVRVTFRHHTGCAGPGNCESRVVPAYSPCALGLILAVYLIEEFGVVCERQKPVRAAFRDIEHSPIVHAQFNALPPEKRRRLGAKVEHDVEYRAARTADQLDFLVWIDL